MPNDTKKKIQADSYRTRLEPFGRDHSLLIVCHNEYHALKVSVAFQVPAMYLPGWECMLAGYQFDKIIVFQEVISAMSDTQSERYRRWYMEFLPTKLSVGNRGNIHLV